MPINNYRIILCLDIDQTIVSHAPCPEGAIDFNGSNRYNDPSAWVDFLTEMKAYCEQSRCEFFVQIITAKATFDWLTGRVFDALHPFLLPRNKQGKAILPFTNPTDGYASSHTRLYYMTHEHKKKYWISTETQVTNLAIDENLLPPIHFCWHNALDEGKNYSKPRVMKYIIKHFDDEIPPQNIFILDDQFENIRASRKAPYGYQGVFADNLYELEQGSKKERTAACHNALMLLKSNIKTRVNTMLTIYGFNASASALVSPSIVADAQEIHFAAKEGQLVHVKALVEEDPNLIHSVDAFNQTPLLWAASRGHDDVVAFFIENGAKINQTTQLLYNGSCQKNHNNTPFDWAIIGKHHATINVFLQTTDARCHNHSDNDLLSLMIEVDNITQVKTLIEKNKSLLNQWDKIGYTPFHYAVLFNRITLFQYFMSEGVDLDAPTAETNPFTRYPNQTAIELACTRNHDDMVIALFEAGARVVPTKDSKRHVIHVLAQKGLLNHVDKLIQRCPDVIHVKDTDNKPLLLWAASRGCDYIVRRLIEQSGVDVNTTDALNQTALMWAVSKGHDSVVKFLINKGANVNIAVKHKNVTCNRRTALDVAMLGGYMDIVSLLMAANAHANKAHTMVQGKTLEQLIANNEIQLIKVLIYCNASLINQLDNQGFAPLHYAAIYGHIELIHVLVALKADINILALTAAESYPSMPPMKIWSLRYPLQKNPFNRYVREQDLEYKKDQIKTLIANQLPMICWPFCNKLSHEKIILKDFQDKIAQTSFKSTDSFDKTSQDVVLEALDDWARQWSLIDGTLQRPYGFFSPSHRSPRLAVKVLQDIRRLLHSHVQTYHTHDVSEVIPLEYRDQDEVVNILPETPSLTAQITESSSNMG